MFEFARLVNFIPRQGQVADTYSSAAVLWRVHRDILAQMDHATEALTSEEQAEYQDARDILYTTDDAGRPAPSQMHLLYEEMRNAYQDLNNSGGSSEEIAQAMANWLVLGHKQLSVRQSQAGSHNRTVIFKRLPKDLPGKNIDTLRIVRLSDDLGKLYETLFIQYMTDSYEQEITVLLDKLREKENGEQNSN